MGTTDPIGGGELLEVGRNTTKCFHVRSVQVPSALFYRQATALREKCTTEAGRNWLCTPGCPIVCSTVAKKESTIVGEVQQQHV